MDKMMDEIYQLYAKDVYRYIFSLCRNHALAEDILQDTMLNAVISIDKFKGECTVKTYLCKIARNLYLNHAKRAEQKNIPLDETEPTDSGLCIEQLLADKNQVLSIHAVLHTLDEPYKEVFSLRVFADLKFNEIGKIFGKNENWARVTFFRSKERIIAQLKKGG